MHLLERHQQAAIVVYLIVISVAYKRFGFEGFNGSSSPKYA
jgi:hypothetical protein